MFIQEIRYVVDEVTHFLDNTDLSRYTDLILWVGINDIKFKDCSERKIIKVNLIELIDITV